MTLHPDRRYAPSRALVLQITPHGALIATNSISRAHVHLVPDSVLVLLSFAGSVVPGEAIARLQGRYDVDSAAFERAADELLASGFLIPEDAPAAVATGHFADARTHVVMLTDHRRVDAYRAAIEKHAPGKFVLELGAGTGVLSMFAARAGARRVVAVEESAIAHLAAALFVANAVTVELQIRNSKDLQLDAGERPDVVVHELFGSDPLAEGLLTTIADANRRLLAPGGRLIPSRLEILACGVALPDPPMDRAATSAAVHEVATRAGLDLGPLERAIDALPDREFQRTVRDARFELLTAPAVLFDLDLATVDEHACAEPIERTLTVTRAGHLSGGLLFFRAHLDDELVLSNAPDEPPTHWGRRITTFTRTRKVTPGDTVTIRVSREVALQHERLRIDLV